MASKTPNYDINYDDKRFTQVETEKKQALSEVEKTYGGMISDADKFYQAQIDASKQWVDTQTKLQNEQTDFAIEQIEQDKAQAKKDYIKEQQGAYVDWQKESNRYGAKAEQMAAQGFINSGYGESAQVSMYNTYQNRATTSKQTYDLAVQNYNNKMTEARLANNAALAEIAYKGLQEQLELGLAGFQYENELLIQKLNKKQETEDRYYSRYQDVLAQMNTENALAEEVRQYEQDYAQRVKEYEESVRQFNQEYKLKKAEYEEGIRQFNEEIARLKAKDAQEYKIEIQQLELQKKEMQQEQARWEAEMAEEKRQFNATHSSSSGGSKISSSKSSSGSSSSSSSKKSSSSSSSSIYKKASTNSSSKNTSSSPSVDMNSVLALGYGPISAATLDKLVSSGKVKETVKNGKYVYSKVK